MADLKNENENCADCGESITGAIHMVYDSRLKINVPICDSCFDDRRIKHETACGQNDWAIQHG